MPSWRDVWLTKAEGLVKGPGTQTEECLNLLSTGSHVITHGKIYYRTVDKNKESVNCIIVDQYNWCKEKSENCLNENVIVARP